MIFPVTGFESNGSERYTCLLGIGVVQSGLSCFFLSIVVCVCVGIRKSPPGFCDRDLQMLVWLRRVCAYRRGLGPWASIRGVTRIHVGACVSLYLHI